MPGFLLIFGFAALAGVFIILTLSRLPFGLGDFVSTLVVVCFWLLVATILGLTKNWWLKRASLLRSTEQSCSPAWTSFQRRSQVNSK